MATRKRPPKRRASSAPAAAPKTRTAAKKKMRKKKVRKNVSTHKILEEATELAIEIERDHQGAEMVVVSTQDGSSCLFRERIAKLASTKERARIRKMILKAIPALDAEEVGDRLRDLAGNTTAFIQEELTLTDAGNARRMARISGEHLRYVEELGGWLAWDGRRWAFDRQESRYQRAREVARSFQEDANREADDKRSKLIWKHSMSSLNISRIRAVVELTRSEPNVSIAPDEMDAQPYLLNVKNGTLDLKTGKLRPHDPRDLITQLIPIDFDPKAKSSLWDKFLHDITGGDKELLRFLPRAIGSALSGFSKEHAFIAVGPGATGKSTLIEAVRCSLGDYAKPCDPALFIQGRHGGGPRFSIASLRSARLAILTEVSDGKKINAVTLKALLSGEAIWAEKKFREGFEFSPVATPWMTTNFLPQAPWADSGLWRRLICIPFDQALAAEDRDPRVKRNLSKKAEHLRAILAWAVKGFREFQRKGLAVPASIQKATDEYRTNQDPACLFVEQCCDLDVDAFVAKTTLWKAYLEWAEQRRERLMLSRNEFSSSIERLGCRDGKSKTSGTQIRVWRGVALLGDLADASKVAPEEPPSVHRRKRKTQPKSAKTRARRNR